MECSLGGEHYSPISRKGHLSPSDVERILDVESPVRTGFTYARSQAYNRHLSNKYVHPRMSRPMASRPMPRYSSDDSQSFEEIPSRRHSMARRTLFPSEPPPTVKRIGFFQSMFYALWNLVFFILTSPYYAVKTVISSSFACLYYLSYYCIAKPLQAVGSTYFTVIASRGRQQAVHFSCSTEIQDDDVDSLGIRAVQHHSSSSSLLSGVVTIVSKLVALVKETVSSVVTIVSKFVSLVKETVCYLPLTGWALLTNERVRQNWYNSVLQFWRAVPFPHSRRGWCLVLLLPIVLSVLLSIVPLLIIRDIKLSHVPVSVHEANRKSVLPIPSCHPSVNKDEENVSERFSALEQNIEQRLQGFFSTISSKFTEQNAMFLTEYATKIANDEEIVSGRFSVLQQDMEQRFQRFLAEMAFKLTEQKAIFLTEIEKIKDNNDKRIALSVLNNREFSLNEIDLDRIKAMIKQYIDVYDADKTGMADYALESAGGSVISIRCTEPYKEKSRLESIYGIPLWYSSYSPRSVIQRKAQGATAGECWAFVGSHGYLTIQLAGRVDVSAISYEHLPSSISPQGHINSAPREFLVWSYQNLDETVNRVLLGRFQYDEEGSAIQTFSVQHKDPLFTPIIELEVLSNYGSEYTCLYRFRVHGRLVKQ